jgi:hypothetical protein
MDWRERRNLQAEFRNLEYDRQERERQGAGAGGDGGCGGCLLVVLAVVVALSVIAWIGFRVAGSSSVSSSQESVQLGPYTQVFSDPLPADPTQAKIIEGFREGMILWTKSDIAMDMVPPVMNYVTGDAVSHMTAAVAAAKARNRVPAGTDRLFRTQVTAVTDTSAKVTTCDDTTKYREENPSTGEIDPAYTAKPGKAYLFETWHMVLKSGNWAISAFSIAVPPNPQAAVCQP